MAFIDGTVVNVALPALQSEFDAPVSQIQWVVESYMLFLSALLLVGGAMGDRYGRRKIFAIGVAVFALGSIASGLAQSAPQLIFARAVQGVGGAMLVPGSLSIITAVFGETERGKAIGTWSGFSAMTTAFGPILGGWLVDTLSWRWVFYINIPVAAAVLILLFARVPESLDEEAPRRLDWWGAAFATAGLSGVIYGLLESSHLGWSNWTVQFATAAGAILLGVFFWWEARCPHAMVPLHLFRSRTFSGANLLTLLLYAALGGSLFFLPLNLIQIQGYSATAAGAALLPFTVLLFTLSRWTGGLVESMGAKIPLTVGSVVTAGAFLLFSLPGTGGSYWTTFFPAVTVLGIGMAICVAPLTTAVMNAVREQTAGVASGINNAVSRTGSLLAVAVLGLVLAGVFEDRLATGLDDIGVSTGVRGTMVENADRLADLPVPEAVGAETRERIRQLLEESFVSGFRRVMWICAGLCLAGAAAAAVWIEGKPE